MEEDILIRKLFCLIITIALLTNLSVSTYAIESDPNTAAKELYSKELFLGVGTQPDGSPNFALNRYVTRAEAITMMVRLLGAHEKALIGNWDVPFVDVPKEHWYHPYVGYALSEHLTSGVSETNFNPYAHVSACQYLTFVLRALGYESGVDFKWDEAWKLSDSIGITDGSYNSTTSDLTRGDCALISFNALNVKMKDSNNTLGKKSLPKHTNLK